MEGQIFFSTDFLLKTVRVTGNDLKPNMVICLTLASIPYVLDSLQVHEKMDGSTNITMEDLRPAMLIRLMCMGAAISPFMSTVGEWIKSRYIGFWEEH